MKCRFDYCSDCLLCCRPDGSDLYLISSNLLHIFDQTLSMLPFATRTDMIEALKRADAKISEVDSFLDTLLAEHNAAGARAQLKTLWIAHVRAVLHVDDEAPPAAPGAGGAGVRNRAPTPPDSPRGAGAGGAA